MKIQDRLELDLISQTYLLHNFSVQVAKALGKFVSDKGPSIGDDVYEWLPAVDYALVLVKEAKKIEQKLEVITNCLYVSSALREEGEAND